MVLSGKARKKIWQTHYFFMSFLVCTTSPFHQNVRESEKPKTGFVITRDDRRRLRCWNFRTISGARNRAGIRLPFLPANRASIYKRLRSPGIDSASLCSLAGLCTINREIGLSHRPARLGIESWAPWKVYKYGLRAIGWRNRFLGFQKVLRYGLGLLACYGVRVSAVLYWNTLCLKKDTISGWI
jgi:hypothetical protein